MSASSKKKLRSQADSGKLTEKQLAEQKQNKEVKLYTTAFVVVMAVLLVVAIVVGVQQAISNSGIRERKTVAYTVGEHELSNAEMSYFFVDTVNTFTQQYGAYAAMFGLDTTKPLDEQFVDAEGKTSWADDFMQTARDNAKSVYALADAAKAAGHTLSEDEMAQVDATLQNLELYAQISGHNSVKSYLKAMYGSGATEEGYRSYLETSILADSYRIAYAEALDFTDADLREAEKDNYAAFSSFTYNQYYIGADKFLTGGTTDEEGNTTYSQEEKDAAAKAAQEAGATLTAPEVKTVADFDKAIAALEINKDKEAASSALVDNNYSNISPSTAQWLAEDGRKEGDTTLIPDSTVSVNEAGEEVTTINGYTAVIFGSRDDNTSLLPNVRHILVALEGGTANEQGQVEFSDEEKAAAKAKADELLKAFTDGEQTEEAFAALATENTADPGSKENGGLYENVFPGQMVPSFNDWVFDDARKAGDTGIVESDYGYHVMYYCGDGSLSYRDLQITNKLTNEAVQAWYEDLLENTAATEGDTSLIRTDIILNRG